MKEINTIMVAFDFSEYSNSLKTELQYFILIKENAESLAPLFFFSTSCANLDFNKL